MKDIIILTLPRAPEKTKRDAEMTKATEREMTEETMKMTGDTIEIQEDIADLIPMTPEAPATPTSATETESAEIRTPEEAHTTVALLTTRTMATDPGLEAELN